ncbi:hypothetical protein ANN_08111 [Periplaneta americana]|uniref:Uncharacterized protein n=1 Tax=Periplaneta americana TaxID=6978 RepID=A0ABQ8T2R5_PERAM|nr:hypothetical protein ANN_08111 [Periplaneta americana]
MAGLCEGGNEPAGSLKAICKPYPCIGTYSYKPPYPRFLLRPHPSRRPHPLFKFVGTSFRKMETFTPRVDLAMYNRHHKARTGIADVLKRRGWEVYEEIHCISSLDSNRRADIVAIHRTQSKGLVFDPTIRFERDALQAQHVDE